MPGLSIIIINYKSWSVLEKCIKSIWSQKTHLIEIIIIDNNSNDSQIVSFKRKYSILARAGPTVKVRSTIQFNNL